MTQSTAEVLHGLKILRGLRDAVAYARGNESKGRVVMPKWHPEFDEELKRDWFRGVSLLEFARRFGSTAGTVKNHARKIGLPTTFDELAAWQTDEAAKKRGYKLHPKVAAMRQERADAE